LILKEADIGQVDNHGGTPLHQCASENKVAMIDKMLSYVYDYAQYDYAQFNDMLSNYGSGKDIRNNDGDTPLATAIRRGHA